ncbi:hypothetical protein GMSM_44370 [Geomonas sp. Red276]
MEEITPDPGFLIKLVRTRMPFGKFAGLMIADLPEPYLVWYRQQGFPEGELGELLQCMYEIKANGLEYLLDPLRR